MSLPIALHWGRRQRWLTREAAMTSFRVLVVVPRYKLHNIVSLKRCTHSIKSMWFLHLSLRIWQLLFYDILPSEGQPYIKIASRMYQFILAFWLASLACEVMVACIPISATAAAPHGTREKVFAPHVINPHRISAISYSGEQTSDVQCAAFRQTLRCMYIGCR